MNIPACTSIYQYLSAQEKTRPVDLIMGFGNFDARVPRHCVNLWQQKMAPFILFTGGRGSGTGEVEGPEARWYAQVAQQYDPHFPPRELLLETQSTNTPENILFSQQLLAEQHPPLALGKEIRSLVYVTTPYRQRRVGLTLKKLIPQVAALSSPPPSDFAQDRFFFESKGYHFEDILRGEIERLLRYGREGHIWEESLPEAILLAYQNIGGKI
jgi:uncharacterized SAM-binding protein YcdF (DUF218 family)